MIALQIIGMIFLIILLVLLGLIGLVLLLAAIVLFAPIRYRADANVNSLGGDGGGFGKIAHSVNLRGTWLFGLVRFGYTADGGFSVRFLWLGRKRKADKQKKEDSRSKQEPEKNQSAKEVVSEKITGGENGKINLSSEKDGRPEPKTGAADKLRDLWAKFKSIRDYPERKAIQRLAINLLKKYLRYLKPRKLRIRGRLGLSDPAQTGMVVGFLGAASGAAGVNVWIDGDFCSQSIMLDVQAADRLTVFGLVYPAFRFCIRKQIRPLIFRFLKS